MITTKPLSRSVAVISLAAILGVALVLRLWGIQFGLPYTYHYDEHFYINTALNLGAGVINNPPYAPTALSNILFGEYAAYFVSGKLLGIFASSNDFEAAYRSNPTVFYLLARLTVAACGTVTVWVLYKLGKLMDDALTGVIAALLMAVGFLHVRDSHYAVPDIAMSFLVLASVTVAISGMRRTSQRAIYLSGLVAGAAVAMKWTALPVVVPVLLAALWNHPKGDQFTPRLLGRHFVGTALAVALGFALGSPQILLNPTPYLHEAFGQYGAGKAGGFGAWLVDDLPGWLFYVKMLNYGLGPVLMTLSAIGAVYTLWEGIRRRDKVAGVLLAFPLVYYFLMGATRHYFARYALPLAPFLILFAALAIRQSARWVGMRKPGLMWGLGGVLLLAALVQPLAASIRHGFLLMQTDTRTLAKTWIETNIPAGAKIASDWPVHGPPLATTDQPVPDAKRTYDLTLVGSSGLSDHPLAWYRENGYDYLIASSFINEIPLVNENQDVARQAFYESLDRELMPLQTFAPTSDGSAPPFIFDEIYGPTISLWQRERPGPTLKIYRVP